MSSADRVRKHRARKKSGEQIPLCACGRQLRGKLSRDRGICSICNRDSAEYKAQTRERVRKLRSLLNDRPLNPQVNLKELAQLREHLEESEEYGVSPLHDGLPAWKAMKDLGL